MLDAFKTNGTSPPQHSVKFVCWFHMLSLPCRKCPR